MRLFEAPLRRPTPSYTNIRRGTSRHAILHLSHANLRCGTPRHAILLLFYANIRRGTSRHANPRHFYANICRGKHRRITHRLFTPISEVASHATPSVSCLRQYLTWQAKPRHHSSLSANICRGKTRRANHRPFTPIDDEATLRHVSAKLSHAEIRLIISSL